MLINHFIFLCQIDRTNLSESIFNIHKYLKLQSSTTVSIRFNQHNHQCKLETMCTMIKNIQAVIAPLLIISYVCGLRIIVFSTDLPKLLFSLLYILFFWSAYIFLMISTIIPNLIIPYINEYYICLFLNHFITLLTVVFGVYYNEVRQMIICDLLIIINNFDPI